MTQAKITWTEDEAIEQFNDDMSNSCDHSDRRAAAGWLADRLGDKARAERLYEAWMLQWQQSNLEMAGKARTRYAR